MQLLNLHLEFLELIDGVLCRDRQQAKENDAYQGEMVVTSGSCCREGWWPEKGALGMAASELQELKERIEKIRANKSGAFTSEREFSEEMLDIRKAFVTIHGEMVLLKNYSSLNFAGLVKILKKYDKRTGGLLSLPFTRRALHQPFFTTEPLTRLVRECEANLEMLFPLEAEVIESDQTGKGETHEPHDPEGSSDRADNIGVYRSTLAAMKAIQGLRKASSTYNPLSLAQFFHGQDEDDGSGAVTTENSASNSLTNSQNQEADEESVHSDD
ncbi:SPX domain [Musa troglodytarum]|uniref:SPX domain n=1 Tax=Musa troglodytarum TaxID=320322 RepID=A0A9E7I1Y7_9LILI|nr:SPX domain [Musa troglodytarum]